MKQLFTFSIAILLFCQTGFGQSPFQLSGKIKDIQAPLYIQVGSSLFDLKVESDGSYVQKGQIAAFPAPVRFITISKKGKINYLSPVIWVDSQQTTIDLLGSNNYQIDHPHPQQGLSEQIEQAKDEDIERLLAENPNALPSLYFLEMQKKRMDPAFLSAFLSQLNESNRQSPAAQRIEKYAMARKLDKLKVGQKLEHFSLPDKNGQSQEVLENNGKRKLVALLSSGCYFSLSSISHLAQADTNNPHGLEVITIWTDRDYNSWQSAYKEVKSGIVWKDLWDQHSFADAYFDTKVSPYFLVISPEGIIEQKFNGLGKRTRKKIAKLGDTDNP